MKLKEGTHVYEFTSPIKGFSKYHGIFKRTNEGYLPILYFRKPKNTPENEYKIFLEVIKNSLGVN